MSQPVRPRGHFGMVYKKGAEGLYQTSVTTQRKSKAKQIEAAKKAAIIAETERLTGSKVEVTARSIDNIVRRWTGVRGSNPD